MLFHALPKLRQFVPAIDLDSLYSPGRMHSWVRETLCALHGHDMMLHFNPGQRICLRCVACGRETPGWHTK